METIIFFFRQDSCPSSRHLVMDPGSTVFVTSPNYPDEYPSNLECNWSFEVMSIQSGSR